MWELDFCLGLMWKVRGLFFSLDKQHSTGQGRAGSRHMLFSKGFSRLPSEVIWVPLLYRTCIPLVNPGCMVSLRGEVPLELEPFLSYLWKQKIPKFLCSKLQCCQFQLHFCGRPWAAAQPAWGWCSSKHTAGGSAALPGLRGESLKALLHFPALTGACFVQDKQKL